MKKFIYLSLVFSCFITRGYGGSTTSDSLRAHLPLHFTANAGQWDESVRFALLGGESTIWFCDNEIVYTKPMVRKNSAIAEQSAPTGDNALDVIRIGFPSIANRRRVEALDTLIGTAHFYHGSDSVSWRKNVTTHGAICYRNIADEIDLEIDLETTINLLDSSDPTDGKLSLPNVRFVENGKLANARVHVAIAVNGTQRSAYLDCSEFHSFLAAAGFSTLTNYRQVFTEGDYAYLFGSTQSTVFPVINAYQPKLNGDLNWFYVKYDIKSRQVLYSTYLGSHIESVSGVGPSRRNVNSLFDVSEGKLFGSVLSRVDFPVTAVLHGTTPCIREPEIGNLIFRLDERGLVDASSFIGGPGVVSPVDIRVQNNRIYLYLMVGWDTLKQITSDAIEPRAVNTWSPGGLICGYLALLNEDLDSLIYGTYIDPSTSGGTWDNPDKFTKMDVGADGSVYFVRYKYPADHAKGVLVNAAMGPGVIREYGAYIIAIAPDLHSYKFATWFGFRERFFTPQDILAHSNGDLYLAGESSILPWEQTEPPLPFIQRYPVARGCENGIVLARFGGDGQLHGAAEICNNSYYIDCSGLIESFCGEVLWAGTGTVQPSTDTIQFALITPFDSMQKATPSNVNISDNILIEVDALTLFPFYSSYWNHRFANPHYSALSRIMNRPNGWLYYTTEPDYAPTPNWYILGNLREDGFFMADIRIPTPCWTILCDLRAIDTIHVERRRGYYNPVEFKVDYSVSNASAVKGARILKSWITIPNGLELIAGADTQVMSPALIGPGESATAFWRVRVTDPSLLGDTASIRCRVMYVDPESGYDYPAPEELCVKEILVLPYDEPDPLLECVIDGPDSLYWRSPGLATSSSGAPGPARYAVTITNRDIDPVPIASFHLRMGEHCSIIGDTVRPGLTLAPGSSHIIIVEVDVDALRFSREIVLEAEAWDLYDLVIHSCRKETFVPGALDLYCSTRGTTRIEWFPASSIAIPPSVMVNIDLENPLDTVRSSISVHADLAAAPHLALLPGDSLVRGPFDVTSSGVKRPSWRFAFTNPPSVNVEDTIAFTYGHDGLVGQCMHIISIEIVDKSVLCSLAAADTVSEAEVLSHAPVALQYVLRNIGTVPVTVDRYELAISPGTGLATEDLLLLPGGVIAPGTDIQLNWSMRPLILRTARVATCTVTAYVGDSILSVCTADIFLPGIDGLRCAIAATDTVRFERDSLRYVPDPVPVQLDLRNILDTEEIRIEAEIDLTGAPRFMLADGEIAQKTLAQLDSHSVAGPTWMLSPLAATTDDAQDIMIRYRSAEQGGWKECRTSIVITAWPAIAEVRCATGGHDSLFVEGAYELIVPDPFQVSHTATNSGTVALTGCEAAIILPPDFALVGSDSIQSFGDDPPGKLAPGESATRWWTVTTTDRLQGFGAKDITWQWSSDQQGSATGCARTVHLVPDPSSGIVTTPLHLFFEAELGGTLPPSQQVTLWTGGGLAMPWSAQPDAWYIDVDPMSGDRAASLAVRPNTTLLGKGIHTSALEVAGAAPNLPKRIAVDYLITSLTGSGDPPVVAELSLGPVYPHPIPLAGEARLFVTVPEGARFQLALYDLLGRQRALLRDGMGAGAEVRIPKPASLGLAPGMYLLRLTSGRGIATRMIAVMK